MDSQQSQIINLVQPSDFSQSSQNIDEYDESQKRAIQSDIKKPLIITAGPGSGKTRTILARIAYIQECDPNARVLALTFSLKACAEMHTRMKNKKNAKICTIHSFCWQIIRSHKNVLAMEKVMIVDAAASRNLMVQIYNKFLGHDAKKVMQRTKTEAKEANDHVFAMKKQISVWKCQGKTPMDVEFGQEYRDHYVMYQQELKAISGIDFDDFMIYAGKILKENPDVLEKYALSIFRYILVDEFQDLSNIQFWILELLYSKNQRVSIVGDEDQSIYAFRGGNPLLFNTFRDLTRKVHVEVPLQINYRSTGKIVDSFISLIERNTERQRKVIKPIKTGGDKVRMYPCMSVTEELNFVCEQIKALKQEDALCEVAVLCRIKRPLVPIMAELKRLGIPVAKGKSVDISVFLSYLGVISGSYSDADFWAISNNPHRGLSGLKQYSSSFQREYKLEKENLLGICRAICQEEGPTFGEQTAMTANALKSLKSFVKNIDSLTKSAQSRDLVDLIQVVWKKFNLDEIKVARSQEEPEDEEDLNVENICTRVVDGAERFLVEEDIQPDSTKLQILDEFVNWCRLFAETDGSLKSRADVFVSTIHGSKGLEFKNVFVVRLNDGVLPMTKSDVNEQEERRLFYVAMSRAKDNLTLSYIRDIHPNVKSRFLKELDTKTLFYVQSDKIPQKLTQNRTPSVGFSSTQGPGMYKSNQSFAVKGYVPPVKNEHVEPPQPIITPRITNRITNYKTVDKDMELLEVVTSVPKMKTTPKPNKITKYRFVDHDEKIVSAPLVVEAKPEIVEVSPRKSRGKKYEFVEHPDPVDNAVVEPVHVENIVVTTPSNKKIKTPKKSTPRKKSDAMTSAEPEMIMDSQSDATPNDSPPSIGMLNEFPSNDETSTGRPKRKTRQTTKFTPDPVPNSKRKK